MQWIHPTGLTLSLESYSDWSYLGFNEGPRMDLSADGQTITATTPSRYVVLESGLSGLVASELYYGILLSIGCQT